MTGTSGFTRTEQGCLLAVQDLSFAYRPGDRPVLADLSWHFANASITTVTGPSGVGKSTLLYLLGLLLTPTCGSIILSGKPVSALADRQRSNLRAATIGFVFQDSALDASRTVLDNVLEGARYAGMDTSLARRRAHDLLEELDVGLRADHRPGEVSGGQAQRVGLCRALVKDPSIVLADEPTGNLDTDSADVVMGALQRCRASGATVVIASHDPRLVAEADHVLALT